MGIEEIARGHEGLIQFATLLVAIVGVYWRLVVRIERIEQSEREAVGVRKEMKDALLAIDSHKVDRHQCSILHSGLADVLNSLRAEIRELHSAVLDIATAVRRNGGSH